MVAFAFVGTALAAQTKTCSKSAMKTCSKAEMAACKKAGVTCIIMDEGASETEVAAALASAELAAENSESIEKKVCDKTGAISFYEKSVCSKSGKVSKAEVYYDVKEASFVNVSPKDVMSAEKEAKVVKTSTKSAKKSCSKSGKKCCASKKKGA